MNPFLPPPHRYPPPPSCNLVDTEISESFQNDPLKQSLMLHTAYCTQYLIHSPIFCGKTKTKIHSPVTTLPRQTCTWAQHVNTFYAAFGLVLLIPPAQTHPFSAQSTVTKPIFACFDLTRGDLVFCSLCRISLVAICTVLREWVFPFIRADCIGTISKELYDLCRIVCVRASVCVCERERDRQTDRQKEFWFSLTPSQPCRRSVAISMKRNTRNHQITHFAFKIVVLSSDVTDTSNVIKV